MYDECNSACTNFVAVVRDFRTCFVSPPAIVQDARCLYFVRKLSPMAKNKKTPEETGLEPESEKQLREMIDKAKTGNAALKKILNSLEQKSTKSKR